MAVRFAALSGTSRKAYVIFKVLKPADGGAPYARRATVRKLESN